MSNKLLLSAKEIESVRNYLDVLEHKFLVLLQKSEKKYDQSLNKPQGYNYHIYKRDIKLCKEVLPIIQAVKLIFKNNPENGCNYVGEIPSTYRKIL